MAVVDLKHRLVPQPQNYKDLTDAQQVSRLIRDIKKMVDTINNGFVIQPMPIPTGFSVTGGTGLTTLAWDDVADDLRKDLDGARIWRAVSASDPSTVFGVNSDKVVLVSCLRTTRWQEVEAAGTYIYWVQWINREGVVSGAAGGIEVTVS